MATPRHVFIGLTEVAGYYRHLVDGFTELGIRVTLVDLSGNPYSYPDNAPKPRWIAAIESILRRIRGGESHGVTPRKIAWAVARSICKAPVALWALARCDVFVFSFRTHFAAHHELRLFRVLRKRSIFIFSGSDARPPYLSGRHVPHHGPINGRMLARRSSRMRRALRRIEQRGDVIVNHPPTAHFHDRPFLTWLWVGIPYPLRPGGLPRQHDSDGPLRIVHAPTAPESKGTPLIRSAIEEVTRRGVAIIYDELVGRPNEEVLEAIAATDVVVDQAYSDTPMASLATEAASLGRPAIVGGYDLPIVVVNTAPENVPPTLVCRPDELAEAIEGLGRDREMAEQLGREAHRFVTEHWQPHVVASRLLAALSGDVPDDAMQAPHPNPYLHGWGLPEERVRQAIRAVVAHGGPEALHIPSDETREALLDFAGLTAQTGRSPD